MRFQSARSHNRRAIEPELSPFVACQWSHQGARLTCSRGPGSPRQLGPRASGSVSPAGRLAPQRFEDQEVWSAASIKRSG